VSEANDVVDVFQKNPKPIARIALNGHNIEQGGVFGHSGAMRSFRVVYGDLREQWIQQAPLTIRDRFGNESVIRVFAFPADDGAIGFVEFI
jgi:hypothetical protein